jgi:hypothetical protein
VLCPARLDECLPRQQPGSAPVPQGQPFAAPVDVFFRPQEYT